MTLKQLVRAFEKQTIIDTLIEERGNVRAAAKRLGEYRTNLYRKLRSHGIVVERRPRSRGTT